MERSITGFSFALLASLASALLLVVQAQPGFININCGASVEYTNQRTNITYEMDDNFTASGEKRQISGAFIDRNYPEISNTLRSFPNGMRNCYILRPDQSKSRTYFLRASFYYGNYDGKNQAPTFDVYVDVNYFATVDSPKYYTAQIIYMSKTDHIQVCLMNTGNGVPFISGLELRALDDDIYQSETGLLRVYWRFNIGGSPAAGPVRYPVDVYDREFTSRNYDNWFKLNTTSMIDLSNNINTYKIPVDILRTAQRSMNSSSPLYLKWTINDWPTTNAGISAAQLAKRWIVFFHFMEIERLKGGQQREFTISMNGNQFTKTVSLEYLKPVVVSTSNTTIEGPIITCSIKSTNKSANPPILNAVEIFPVYDRPYVPTAQDDVEAINDIKRIYDIKKESWQGDPCVPTKYAWDGLSCSDQNPPRIISLKLNSSNLMGQIVSSFVNLSTVEYLDLSNNQLTGAIPESLATLPNLTFLNLSENNLTGTIPEALKKRADDNALYMSLTGNTNLCLVDPCSHKKKKDNIFVPVVTSVPGFFVLLICALAIIWLIKRKRKAEPSEKTLRLKNQHFKYGEISKITGNFGRVIGEGGFGNVYLGKLDNGTPVAVKILSKLSKQGHKEFEAEAKLLTIVHHGNLVSLFGYCDDSKHMALIYEYMANGDLRQHLSEDRPKVLTWSQRLQIAVDAAQGLDYLHNGCKPSIIHRDLKTSNILLNEDFRAKISDFGLSRAFVAENDSYVSTHPAGTFGYLGPELRSSRNCNKKSDVYSFGIVLLELITGQPAVMRSQDGSDVMHILQWFTPIVESGDIQSIMDPRLQEEFNINSAWKVAEIAISCTQPRAIQRPDISHVLAELKESSVSKSSGSLEMTTSEIECDSVPMAR